MVKIADLETPALIVDLDIMERNLARVADYARQRNLRLRPHTKTHKTPAMGARQVALGAVGLTIAKVGEAEVMLGAGSPDLLIMYPVIGRSKLERLMRVARQTRLTVSMDSLEAARQLSDAASEAQVNVGVLAEIDVGMGRVGVAPGPELVELARGMLRLPALTFEGISFYPHIKMLDDEGNAQLKAVSAMIDCALAGLRREGIAVNIVTGGSTPTLFDSHRFAGMNEIRPGTYIYNDRSVVSVGACGWEDVAARMLVTVVSTAKKDHMIIDGGSKTFSSDRLPLAGEVTFGLIEEEPDALFHKMNEEHGYVDMSRAKGRFQVGDRLRVIPNHICAAVNLHERVYGYRGDTVEQVFVVEGRGKLQ
jgi:D-serine deaminase-like pyridoxal phosphate-dependent protein